MEKRQSETLFNVLQGTVLLLKLSIFKSFLKPEDLNMDKTNVCKFDTSKGANLDKLVKYSKSSYAPNLDFNAL